MSGAPLPPLALYVHMPWCVKKCPYCDFNSHQLVGERADRAYIDLLLEDFAREESALAGRRIESVFIGGGTPSLFAPEDIARLLAGLRARAPFADDVEITLEANPGTIERGRFAGYRDAGVNRVSLGAQSFAAAALKALGRIHSPEDTLRAVDELRAAGLDNFNLDLMYALPGQTVAAALDDVRTACRLEPAHISHYQLTLEPGTVFHERPPPQLPDDEAAWIMQTECQQLLREAGFAQYEVSAYARPAAHCRHNLNYWQFGDYVGIGAGAHGKLTLAVPRTLLRTAKPKQPREFRERLAAGSAAIGERRVVPAAEIAFEFMLGALRLNAGFTEELFEARTGLRISELEPTLAGAAARGLLTSERHVLEGERGCWRATTLGMRFLNDLQAAFLA
jgi:oxygen-independent coproporphyrinogen-3 oxidase